ncbi:MAG: carbohydrate ABC transporter permease [Vallitaleaceae bacterium]|nr:carbohydrate ABC transporter permease [Vallitaleaceae bacterium]
MSEHRLGKFYWLKASWIYIVCFLLMILSIMPFWILIVNATRSTDQIQQGFSLIPSGFMEYNYTVLTNRGFDIWRGFLNSFTISASATFMALYFSALTAYGLVVYDFKAKKYIFALIAFILMIPAQISMIGFYRMMLNANLTDSYIPLIFPAMATPATVFFIRQYLLSSFPKDLVSAARIDGAKEIQIFHTIALPVMKPALATMGIFAFVGSWNNFLMPLMLISDEKKYTLPMLVQLLKADIYRTEFGGIYLGIAMTILPLLLVYLIFSRYIIAGVALGGLKE